MSDPLPTPHTVQAVRDWIYQQALALGFADCGFVTVDNPVFAQQLSQLKAWLAQGLHGELSFLEDNHHLRANPALLVQGTKTIISVRLDYLHALPTPRRITDNLRPNHAIIARYARGRDYHKTMRSRLKTLAQLIQQQLPHWYGLGIGAEAGLVFRPFSDSAPIFETSLAEQAGLGFKGKHTLLINERSGSYFNLGELFVSLDLQISSTMRPSQQRCGSCTACLDICPTQAIIAPNQLNAAACISYLTIELKGAIPVHYRRAIGNRIFGCDDCQLICPWNKFAKISTVADYQARHGLDDIGLLTLWGWDETVFATNTEGSPLRRTGHIGLLRNIAIALGNAPFDPHIIHALQARLGENDLLDEHILWAIGEQQHKAKQIKTTKL